MVLSLIGYFVYSAVNRYQQAADSAEVKVFSENFVRDYSTYKASQPDVYNTKISQYVSPAYKASFLEKYELGPIKSLEPTDINNYSRYKSATITVVPMGSSYNITIDYTADVLDASLSTSLSTVPSSLEITVIKEGDKYYINTFAFGN